MSKKSLTIDLLSRSSIERAVKEIREYRDSLQHKVDIFAKTLADRGVDFAQIHIADLDAIFTGELIESIHSEFLMSGRMKTIFAIVADCKHAAFVEFGTGQMGIDSPYPYNLPEGVSWEYASGEKIRQNAITGRYYWFYPGKDGKIHYTEGMPARPFMHETGMDLQAIVAETAKKIFR